MKHIIFALIVCLGLCMPASATELQYYQDPIPYGNYVKDLDSTLTKAVERNHWLYSKDEAGTRYADLDYKSYKIKVQLVIKGDSVALKLLDAQRPDCGKKRCQVDMDKVEGWIVKLRRNIAFDITKLVRDDAIRRSFAD